MDVGRITQLEAEIRRHQELYYNGEPIIEDAKFDELWDELRGLDPGNALFSSLGRDSADGWPKARHLIPMGSQDKASNPEDFLSWCAKVGHAEYFVQFKLDGASLELQYEDGRLLRAVTRGDGIVGDDITANARRMDGVLDRLPEAFSGGVRGEVLMTHEVHARSYPDKANCRNAANGLMKRKDGRGSDELLVICYDAAVSNGSPSPFADEPGKLEWLGRLGFHCVTSRLLLSPEAVIDYRAHVMDERATLPWDIDGLVVKGRGIDLDDLARARPEKQIAFKFSLEEAVSTLREVLWSESGSTFTPIGLIEPVRLAGTMVQRANLCNTNMINSLGLRIGSRVVITKRGEIIPKIESLVENPADSRAIAVPESCSCGASLVDEGTRLLCPNPACPKKELHRLEKWLDVLDIRSFGVGIIARLHAAGRVRRIADLYSLTVEELAEYDRMGDTLARKILRNLSARNEVSLARFIAGFDIEGIGELIVEKAVAAGFDSLDKLRTATVEELAAVDGLAEITARTVVEGLGVLGPDMDALLAVPGFRIAAPQSGGPLSGKSLCFTGELLSMKRPEAEALVKALGGSCKPSVTKGLSWLVTNDPGSGSDKNKKALSYGIPILDEDGFLALIGRK